MLVQQFKQFGDAIDNEDFRLIFNENKELERRSVKEPIALAQATHAKDSDDWGTIANLRLYHLGEGNPVEGDRFYRSLLNAPKEMIEMGIKDLEDLRE